MWPAIISDALNWLVSTIGALGYFGIFVLMALESMVIPVPAEVILIPAGYLAYQGHMSISLLIIFAAAGSLLGSLISYYVALLVGRKGIEKLVKKYGSFMFIRSSEFERTEGFFRKHGSATIFFSRFVAGVRHLISLPAGFLRMDLKKFSVYTVLGAGIYNAFLVFLGYFAGQNLQWIQSHTTFITILVILLVIIGIIIYIKSEKILNALKKLF